MKQAAFVLWYQSRVVWGAIIALLSSVLTLIGLPAIGVEMQRELQDALVIIGIAIGGGVAVQGRRTVAGGRPLKLRKPAPGAILPMLALLALLPLTAPLAGCTRPERERIALAVVEGVQLTRELCVKFLGIWPNGQTGFHVACAMLVIEVVPPPASETGPASDGRSGVPTRAPVSGNVGTD